MGWDKKGKVCVACAANQFSECEHVRGGKTAKEHANGTFSNRLANRAARVEWQHDSNASNKTFPSGTCNGKRNRKKP